MDELRPLRSLARAMGVATRYTDGLGRRVTVAPETLLRVCAVLGAAIERPGDAAAALRAHRAAGKSRLVPPVLVAWDGTLPALPILGKVSEGGGSVLAQLHLADGAVLPLVPVGDGLGAPGPLPLGYHRLTIESASRQESCTVISAPVQSWRRPGSHRSWGVGTHLAALRSARSRSVGDLHDLGSLCRWVRERGGDLVTVLPLLPTFNTEWPEPSPYSPVSRLFWSELILDLGDAHLPTSAPADAGRAVPPTPRSAPRSRVTPTPTRRIWTPSWSVTPASAAHRRGSGRNWRDWPAAARAGTLEPDQVDPDDERFHLVAQTLARAAAPRAAAAAGATTGFRLGLDLAVGGHPDGYDPWSRQALFGGRDVGRRTA